MLLLRDNIEQQTTTTIAWTSTMSECKVENVYRKESTSNKFEMEKMSRCGFSSNGFVCFWNRHPGNFIGKQTNTLSSIDSDLCGRECMSTGIHSAVMCLCRSSFIHMAGEGHTRTQFGWHLKLMIFPLTSAFDSNNNNRCDVRVFFSGMKNEIPQKLIDS